MAALRIALAQINPTVGDIDGNVRLICGAIERAKEKKADLVVFPELAISGCPPEGLLLEPDFLADCRRALEKIAPQTKDIAAVVGFPEGGGERARNSAAFLTGGEVQGSYAAGRKLPGTGGYSFETNGVRCTLVIGDDIQDGNEEVESDVVINLSAWPFHADGFAERRDSVAGFARRVGAFVCSCNLVGGQDELVFDGGSMIVDPKGELVAEAARFEEDLLVADISVDPDSGGRCRLVEPRETEELDGIEEIHRALVLGTRDYAGKNGFKKAVIGLSGGVDSSLVAAIAVEALGEESVVGVTMPSRYSSPETVADAEGLARNLGMRLVTVPIEPAFGAYEGMLAEAFAEGEAGVEMENLQARIRANILMALSNRFGWLVLAAGNRSEAAVGYCTLYGDTAGGFAPIKHVPKTVVYDLAGRLNGRAGREVIPKSVIDRPPSAELKHDQKDEDSLPPYDVLDRVLECYIDRRMAARDIVKLGFEEGVVGDVIRLLHRSEFKRRQSPPGVRIAPPTSGRKRLPITNRYR